MFLKLNQLLLAAAIGIAALAAGTGAASAMPQSLGPQINPEIVPVQFVLNDRMSVDRGWQFRRDGNRCRTRLGNCRHFHQGYYYQTPWWTLPLFIGGALSHQSYHGGSHVQWCLSRYRSYDTRTDTWLGNSGRRYRCNSPY